jgi:hypothetical protein
MVTSGLTVQSEHLSRGMLTLAVLPLVSSCRRQHTHAWREQKVKPLRAIAASADADSRCLCWQAVQKAATDVGSAGKALQSGGASATPIPFSTPSPPTLNINIPGLGGNGGAQGPPGLSYSAPATTQTTTQVPNLATFFTFPLLCLECPNFC